MAPKGSTTAGLSSPLKDDLWTLPEPESAGASTYVILLQTDEEGRCAYLPQPDRPRRFGLGRAFGKMRLGFIHTLRTVLLIDPTTNALRGLAAFFDGHLRTFLFGAMWGTWLDDRGHRHQEDAPTEQLSSPKFFTQLSDRGDRIRIEFGVKADNLELFTPSVRKRLRQADSEYRLALDFAVPSGRFLLAEVVAIDPRTKATTITHPLDGFPIRWPPLASPMKPPPAHAPKSSRATRPEADNSHSGSATKGAASGGESPRQPTAAPEKDGPSPGAYGFSRSTPSGDNSGGRSPQTAEPGPTGPAPPRGTPSNSKVRTAPRLRLKPRPGGASRTPPPPESPRQSPGDTGGYVPPPPPRTGTSYRLRPGQVSDPLGRKTPFGEASGSRTGSTPSGGSPVRRPPPRENESRSRPAPRRPEPLPRTENLPTSELIDVIRKETDVDRRWKIIEPNLMMGRAERTYSLIAHFAELMSDRTPEWPAARLRTAFAAQPGAVLIGIMDRWHMNQVLPVAEANAESAKIMQWLREREVDRMLRLQIDREITNAESARKALRVDRAADEAMIRKTWRILLQFLNADHGRSDEKAIHRQKDEIAKFLQSARDYLLKVTFR